MPEEGGYLSLCRGTQAGAPVASMGVILLLDTATYKYVPLGFQTTTFIFIDISLYIISVFLELFCTSSKNTVFCHKLWTKQENIIILSRYIKHSLSKESQPKLRS